MEQPYGLRGARMSASLYLCVHVPEFAAQARLRHRSEQRQQAVAILDGVPPLQIVCSMTRRALRDGVAHGMTRAELDSFPDVVCFKRSLAEEQTAHCALLEMAGNFTPRFQMMPLVSGARACVLDVTGTSRIFGSSQQLVMRVRQATEALGLHGNIAVSHNFHTALYAAPYAARKGMVIPAGREREALGTLPLEAIRPTPEQAETLSMWGLHTCCELAALPEVDLIARLGQAGKRLRLLALGELPHLLVAEEEDFVLAEHVTFEAAVDVLDSLLFVLGRMLDQLIRRAMARSLALASVTVKLTLDGAAPQDARQECVAASEHIRTVKPALPLMDRDLLLKLLHLDLQAHPPSAAITAIHLTAEPGDRSKVQLGLFSPQLPEPTRLDITMARIAALVGEDRVGRVRLLDTHRPDSFVMERFVSPSNLAPKDAVNGNAVALRRLRPPTVLAMQMRDGMPVAFPMNGRRYEVQEACGPWRRSGDWWSASIWSRDEWDVRATTSEGDTLLCVIAHDLLREQWQMDALYD